MRFASLNIVFSVAGIAMCGQPIFGQVAAALPENTTIPIAFTRSIDANHVHAGDAVQARTTQTVNLGNGRIIHSGAQVIGHVVSNVPFTFDRTPYAKQKESHLSIHFDSVSDHGQATPLNVYIRAIADPITVADAERPSSLDDTLTTYTQIGGDQRYASQDEIVSRTGDVVAYQRHGGVVAHLIASFGNSSDGCDGSDTEQPVAVFSASACGLYGFTDVTMVQNGRRTSDGTFVLASHRGSPTIWAHSQALLEVTTPNTSVAAR